MQNRYRQNAHWARGITLESEHLTFLRRRQRFRWMMLLHIEPGRTSMARLFVHASTCCNAQVHSALLVVGLYDGTGVAGLQLPVGAGRTPLHLWGRALPSCPWPLVSLACACTLNLFWNQSFHSSVVVLQGMDIQDNSDALASKTTETPQLWIIWSDE